MKEIRMKTFVIAELGINHDGDIIRAHDLIATAKECGCNAVKLQTYTLGERTNPGDKNYELFKRCCLTFDQQAELFDYAKEADIECFSTPFGEESLKFLIEDIGIRRIKISSFDITNLKFLKAVNEYGKKYYDLKVIMSTGMSNAQEIQQALDCFVNVPCLTLLHCVSAYPTSEKEVNLSAIRTLKHMVSGERQVGYSDHTDNIFVPAAAILVGATTIEKHFILDKNGPGVDAPVSADPKMMKDMIKLIETYESFLGNGELSLRDIEKPTVVFRRKS